MHGSYRLRMLNREGMGVLEFALECDISFIHIASEAKTPISDLPKWGERFTNRLHPGKEK